LKAEEVGVGSRDLEVVDAIPQDLWLLLAARSLQVVKMPTLALWQSLLRYPPLLSALFFALVLKNYGFGSFLADWFQMVLTGRRGNRWCIDLPICQSPWFHSFSSSLPVGPVLLSIANQCKYRPSSIIPCLVRGLSTRTPLLFHKNQRHATWLHGI